MIMRYMVIVMRIMRTFRYLFQFIIIFACCKCIKSFRPGFLGNVIFNRHLRHTSITQQRSSYPLRLPLQAKPQVGDVVIAEVDDFIGSLSNPLVTFKIQKDGEEYPAQMPTKFLGPAERLALQAGTMIEVKVVEEGTDTMLVTLRSNEKQEDDPMMRRVMSSMRESAEKPTTLKSRTAAVQPPGKILKTLQIGDELEGKVVGGTPYALFLDVGVFRSAKGGKYANAHGMLHRNDMDKNWMESYNSKQESQSTQRGGYVPKLLAPKGTSVTVYVKEVQKNSGRLSVTMNPEVNKHSIIEEKQKKKEQAQQRKRERRLRLLLEGVVVGQTVEGVVQEVIAEGVLIKITSFGSLNVTGIIMKQDLPEQFKVPPDLKENFQVQLLSQDFTLGRRVTCGVMKVNPMPKITNNFNLKLLFEDFGSAACDELDDLIIVDKFDSLSAEEQDEIISSQFIEDDDDNDDDDDDAFFEEESVSDAENEDDDIMAEDDSFESTGGNLMLMQKSTTGNHPIFETYDKLKSGKAFLCFDDLYSWDSLLDLIDAETISGTDFARTARSKISNENEISLEEFGDIVTALQELAVNSKQSVELDGVGIDDDVEEMYKELCGSEATVSTERLFEWDEVSDLINDGLLSEELLLQLMREVNPTFDDSDSFDLNQFAKLIELIDSKAEEIEILKIPEDNLNEIDDAFNEEADTDEEVPTNAVTSSQDTISDVTDDEADDDDALDDESLDAVAREVFDELRGKAATVSIAKLKKWDELLEMIEEGLVSAADVDAMAKEVGATNAKTGLNFEQFLELLDLLDAKADESGEEADTDEEAPTNAVTSSQDTMSDVTDDEADDDDALDDESLDAVAREVFDELRGKAATVSIAKLKKWDELLEMIEEGLVSAADVDAMAKEVGATNAKTGLNFEQFLELLDLLDAKADESGEEVETTDALQGSGQSSKQYVDQWSVKENKEILSSPVNVSVNDEDDAGTLVSADDLNEAVYEELRNSRGLVAVKDLLEWDEMIEMMESGYLDEQTLNIFLDDIGCEADGELDFAQFSQLLTMIDELSLSIGSDVDSDLTDSQSQKLEHGEISDEDEEISAILTDVFNGLSTPGKNTLRVKDFLACETIQEEILDGSIKMSQIEGIVQNVLSINDAVENWKDAEITLEQFGVIMEQIDADIYDGLDQAGSDNILGDNSDVSDTTLEELGSQWGGGKAGISSSQTTGKGFARSADEIAEGKRAVRERKGLNREGKGGEESKDDVGDDVNLEARELFNELCGKNSLLSVRKLKQWDELNDLINSGELSRRSLNEALVAVGAMDSGTLDESQFLSFLDLLYDSEVTESEEEPKTVIGLQNSANSKVLEVEQKKDSKGNAEANIDIDQQAEEDVNTDDTDDDDFEVTNGDDDMLRQVALNIFDELRGSADTVSVPKLKKWDDLVQLIDDGILDINVVDALISEVGVTDNKIGLDFDQFYRLFNMLGELDDENDDVSDDVELEMDDLFVSSREDDEDIDEVEEASLVFNQLLETKNAAHDNEGKVDVLTVADIFDWEDISEMLRSGAVKERDVVAAMEAIGISNPEDRSATVNFEQFYNFLIEVDKFVDHKMLQGGVIDLDNADDDPASSVIDESEIETDLPSFSSDTLNDDKDRRIDAKRGFNAIEGNNFDEDEEDDEEVIAMFEELSKGKSYITEKALRKWDELEDLVNSGMITADIIDKYIDRLNIANGRVDLTKFAQFVEMIENVWIDDMGNFVADADEAMDLSDMEDEEEEED